MHLKKRKKKKLYSRINHVVCLLLCVCVHDGGVGIREALKHLFTSFIYEQWYFAE